MRRKRLRTYRDKRITATVSFKRVVARDRVNYSTILRVNDRQRHLWNVNTQRDWFLPRYKIKNTLLPGLIHEIRILGHVLGHCEEAEPALGYPMMRRQSLKSDSLNRIIDL